MYLFKFTYSNLADAFIQSDLQMWTIETIICLFVHSFVYSIVSTIYICYYWKLIIR